MANALGPVGDGLGAGNALEVDVGVVGVLEPVPAETATVAEEIRQLVALVPAGENTGVSTVKLG